MTQQQKSVYHWMDFFACFVCWGFILAGTIGRICLIVVDLFTVYWQLLLGLEDQCINTDKILFRGIKTLEKRNPNSIHLYMKMDTDLWQCVLMVTCSADPLGDQIGGTMPYPNQLHYPDTELTSPCSILKIPSVRLWLLLCVRVRVRVTIAVVFCQ